MRDLARWPMEKWFGNRILDETCSVIIADEAVPRHQTAFSFERA